MAESEFVVRFPLTGGERPDSVELDGIAAGEQPDLESLLALSVCYDPDAIGRADDMPRIVLVEVLFAGIAAVEGLCDGLSLEPAGDGFEIIGYPAPIIRFVLDGAADEGDFLRSISATSVELQTVDEPAFFEDWNGYCHILGPSDIDEAVRKLRESSRYCGSVFEFPEGLPLCGYSIPFSQLSGQV